MVPCIRFTNVQDKTSSGCTLSGISALLPPVCKVQPIHHRGRDAEALTLNANPAADTIS